MLPQTAPTPDLHAVLAGGANIGGTYEPSAYSTSGLAAPATMGGANGAPAATSGGGGQAAEGATTLSQDEQLHVALTQVVTAVQNLVKVLTDRLGGAGATATADATSGAGGSAAAGQAGQCGMSGCTMDHSKGGTTGSAPTGSAPTGAPPANAKGAGRGKKRAQGGRGAPAQGAPARGAPAQRGASRGAGTVDPGSVKDKTGTDGLTGAAKAGLTEAHKYGLPLVSGKRSGSGKSDHDHGNAIDVSTLAIGSPESNGATPQMKAYAERMRAAGKAGQLGVKYIISDGRIASATNNWEWRPYTYPGKSASSLAALKTSDRGEYNRLQHFDHVHVSFG